MYQTIHETRPPIGGLGGKYVAFRGVKHCRATGPREELMHDAQHNSRMLPFVLRNEMIAFYIRQPKERNSNDLLCSAYVEARRLQRGS
jgi:hypothetical protein